jgi:signal transduction histidine kinase
VVGVGGDALDPVRRIAMTSSWGRRVVIVEHLVRHGFELAGDANRFLNAANDSANRAASLTHRLLAFSRRQTLDPKPVDANRLILSDDPKVGRLIDGAIQGAQRGAALTQRLLAFARRQDLKVEPRDVADLIRGAANLIERSAGAQLEVRLDFPSTLPAALVDANQIELAVLNLVVNARDAMPDGGVVTISADQALVSAMDALPAGRYVRLRVSDNGCGMDRYTLAKATEPFFSTKELGKGTGLGLSMIQGLRCS